MMKILLTNDDGYDAVGLKALIKALTPIAKVMDFYRHPSKKCLDKFFL